MSQGDTYSAHKPMTRDEIKARVISVLAEEAVMDPGDVRESHSLEGDLMFDSLMSVESVMELEEEFDIHVPDEAAQEMRTVRDVLEGMYKLLGA